MGRLNDFLVKESSTGFLRVLNGLATPSPEAQARLAAEERQRALFERYREQLEDPTQPIPDEVRQLVLELFGEGVNVDDPQTYPNFAWGGQKSAVLSSLKARNRNTERAKANGTPLAHPGTPSVSVPAAETNPAADQPVESTQPTQLTAPEVAPTAEASLTLGGPDFGITTPQTDLGAGETTSPLAQPAPVQKQPAAPQGLTRDETKILLSQGYMPTSAGGYMNNADGAAQMLARMNKDENYNPGAVITDAKRLDKIRNEMLHNFEYTTAGGKLMADAALLQEAADYERMRANRDSQHQSGVDAHKARLTEEAERNLLHQGQNEYMRWVNAGSTGPMSEAASYYYQKENAGEGVDIPLPASVRSDIDAQVQRYSQQNAPKYGRQEQVTYRNPHYITGDEVMRSTQGNRANTVLRWKSEMSPKDKAAAEAFIQAKKEQNQAKANIYVADVHDHIANMNKQTQAMQNSVKGRIPQQPSNNQQQQVQTNDQTPANPTISSNNNISTPQANLSANSTPLAANNKHQTPGTGTGISKLGSMNKLASQMLEKAQEFIEENPGLITGLAATGGLGALGGAALTNVDEDDSAGEKFKKRLKNALLTGGLAAGAYGAVNYGANKIQNALPEDDVSPISAAVHSSPVRLLGIGTGAGIGAAIQGKDSKNAISEVFGNKHVSKDMLVDILNNPSQHSSALTKIKNVWSDSDALKDWVERTGIDTSKLVDPEFSNMAAYTDEATDLLNKNKAMKDIADKINITPDKLAKWRLAAKRNKYLLGAAGAGLLLPEGLSTVGDLVGRLFGSSLHE